MAEFHLYRCGRCGAPPCSFSGSPAFYPGSMIAAASPPAAIQNTAPRPKPPGASISESTAGYPRPRPAIRRAHFFKGRREMPILGICLIRAVFRAV